MVEDLAAAEGVANSTRNSERFEVIELGHDLFIGSPHLPVHTPFMYTMTAMHRTGTGMLGQPSEISGANDMFAMGTHCGTHMDGLSHIACHACLADGTVVTDPGVEDFARGVTMKSRRALQAIVAPGVLLDFPALFGVDEVADDAAITPEDIEACAAREGVEIEPGSVVLFRMGRDRTVQNAPRFESFPMPGPNLDSAKLLVKRGIIATGSDTLGYERMPGERPLEVHAELIPKAGIHILEGLNLAELAKRQLYKFVFAVLPLRIIGATGCPVNPVALIPRANSASQEA